MNWPRIIDSLDGRYDIYAPDLRGRGQSADLPGPFGLAAHVRDLTALLDHYSLEKVVYVGHSLGAYIGLELARAAPERIAGLVLVDGGIGLPLPQGADPEEVLRAVLGPAIERLELSYPDADAYIQFWRGHPALQDADAWSGYLTDYVKYDLAEAVSAFKSRVNPEAVRADGRGPLSPEMATRIDQVQHPTLLLTAPRGLFDQPQPFLPDTVVRDKLRINPNLRHAQIPDTNHYTITLGRGAPQVARHIDEFIAGLK
jgi:pimeloyl-ACP methyl ester carboxylesterase